MKKLFALILCIIIVCAMPIAVFAEGETPDTSEVVEESVAETEVEETLPVSEEPVPEETPEEVIKTTSELVVEYIKLHLEEISVIVTLILSVFYQVRKHKALNKSVATLNNNAITVAENSNNAMQQALTEVGGMSTVVGAYKDEVAALLAEVRRNADEKKLLEKTLAEVHTHLTQAKLANVEFANELAELLVLANIPNSKKDELYARHIAAVDAISVIEAEENVTLPEVNEDDNGQKE